MLMTETIMLILYSIMMNLLKGVMAENDTKKESEWKINQADWAWELKGTLITYVLCCTVIDQNIECS